MNLLLIISILAQINTGSTSVSKSSGGGDPSTATTSATDDSDLRVKYPYYEQIDAATNGLPANVPGTAVIPPSPIRGVDIHFEPSYQRIRGQQFYNAYKTLTGN